jgi:uncharacterized membrane protein YcaP (DUF421 family)
LAGKREIEQMVVFDLVVLLLLANAVKNATVDPDTSLPGGVLKETRASPSHNLRITPATVK